MENNISWYQIICPVCGENHAENPPVEAKYTIHAICLDCYSEHLAWVAMHRDVTHKHNVLQNMVLWSTDESPYIESPQDIGDLTDAVKMLEQITVKREQGAN
jgi:hypothetical protein